MRALVIASAALLSGCNDDNIYTLYKTTAEAPRLHVATFDVLASETENRSSCHQTGEVLSQHANNRFRYWCEKGRYRA